MGWHVERKIKSRSKSRNLSRIWRKIRRRMGGIYGMPLARDAASLGASEGAPEREMLLREPCAENTLKRELRAGLRARDFWGYNRSMNNSQQQTVPILDFGAQYVQLIARRVREAG